MKKFTFYAILLLFILTSCRQTPKHESPIHYDEDGMLVIQGQRTFILGSYHLPKSEAPYQELAAAGFNLVQTPATQEALDLAQQAGLLSWISVGAIDPQKKEQSTKVLQEKIGQFKDHPALLFWETVDEPAWTWNKAGWRVPPEPIIETYQIIKATDPTHLIYLNHAPANLIGTLEKYNPGTDIVACDIYPVIKPNTPPMYGLFPDGYHGSMLNPYISQIALFADKMRKVAGPNRPVFMVLQAFAWETLREKPVDSLVLYPTHHELRFMAYQSIVNGANGINYWGLNYVPARSPFWNDLKSVVSELASIQDILASSSRSIRLVKQYHELGYDIDMGVQIMTKKARGSYYLFTVNTDKNPTKVSISGFGRDKVAKVLFENRKIEIENRQLTDSFKPFEVHVYELGEE